MAKPTQKLKREKQCEQVVNTLGKCRNFWYRGATLYEFRGTLPLAGQKKMCTGVKTEEWLTPGLTVKVFEKRRLKYAKGLVLSFLHTMTRL